MTIYERIRQILQYSATRQINFICQGVPVNFALFDSVANAVGNTDTQHPIVGVQVNAGLPFGVGAAYSPLGNVFVLRDNVLNQPFDEITLVHESVHCGFDIQRRINWRWFGQEACAYIAGALYAINKGIPTQTMSSRNDVYSIALSIAQQIRPGATVTWEQYLPLRTHLRNLSRTPGSAYEGYEDTNYVNDGPTSR